MNVVLYLPDVPSKVVEIVLKLLMEFGRVKEDDGTKNESSSISSSNMKELRPKKYLSSKYASKDVVAVVNVVFELILIFIVHPPTS